MSQTLYARVDENGHIVLPPDLAQKLGLLPGDEIRVMPVDQSVRLGSSITPLKRVYLDKRKRTSREYFVGDSHKRTLFEIWNDRGYRELRKRLRDFDFSPCVFCNSCEMANENLEDCFGNLHPTCGGCLWVRGLIRCP